jgi:hypothetical protein
MKSVFELLFGVRIDVSYKDADELFVSNRLKDILNSGEYAVLDNLLLHSNGNTSMSQIDHIVISVYGIFCIETKSHQGWIFGSERNPTWTQVRYRNKYPITNPFHQNYGHIKALELLLGSKLHNPITSLIAFPSADEIHVKDTDLVGNTTHILRKILSINKKQYTYSECTEIIKLIRGANMTSEKKHEQHINEIRKVFALSSY